MKLNHLIVGTCVSTACALCSSAESVGYFDFEAGTEKSTNGVMVTATTAELGEGWYVASGEVTVGTLALTGDANLILADSATLTVNGGIAGEGCNLTVWGQEDQTGKLVVNGTNGVNGAVTIPVIWPGIPGSMKVKIIDSLRDNPVYSEVFKAWYAQNYGADAVKAGGKGGAGIVCEVLTVNGGEVSVSGGAGGQGDVGRRGEDGKDGTIYYAAAGTDGGPGGKGGDGGKGGTAIVCTACVLRGGTLAAMAAMAILRRQQIRLTREETPRNRTAVTVARAAMAAKEEWVLKVYSSPSAEVSSPQEGKVVVPERMALAAGRARAETTDMASRKVRKTLPVSQDCSVGRLPTDMLVWRGRRSATSRS